MPVLAWPRAVLTAPLTKRAWREAAYCLVGFPVAVVGFGLTLALLAAGAVLTVSLIGAVLGLLLLTAAVTVGRRFADLHRQLARALIGERVTASERPRPTGRLLARLEVRLRDGATWRPVAYAMAKLVLAAAGLYALAIWLTGLLNLIAPVRWAVLGTWPWPAADGLPTLTPIPFGGGAPHTTSLLGSFAAAAVGMASVLMAPWAVRGVVAVDRWLIRALLGTSELAERVRTLEETRTQAVDDSAALLRRLERDLHDGAQVRLVALAMSLDMARESLGADGEPVADPQRVRELVGTAHHNVTEALGELRDLVRGLHPHVLDDGLPDALASLTARSTVPIELAVAIPERPTPAIETIAYFCAAELVTNMIKHSGAARAVLRVDEDGELLRLRLTDDGHGGARLDAGGGLLGLKQRVRTVDGALTITSPAGGPTTVAVDLPLHA